MISTSWVLVLCLYQSVICFGIDPLYLIFFSTFMIPNSFKNPRLSDSRPFRQRATMQTQPNTSRDKSLNNKPKNSRSRSPSLEKEEKYPPPITPIRLHSTHQKESWVLQTPDVIQEKSEIQEDQNLQQMIEQLEGSYMIQSKSVNGSLERQQPELSTFTGRRSRSKHLAPSLSLSSEMKQSEMQQEQSADSPDMPKEMMIIEKSAIFWKREQYNELDLRDFQELIKNFVLIRARPAPLNAIGQRLLKNGYFVIAYIKYMTSRGVDAEVRSIMFEMFKNEFEIETNLEEFQQAYNNNLKDLNGSLSQSSSSEVKERKNSFNFFRGSKKQEDSSMKRLLTEDKSSFKRKFSDEFGGKDVVPKSREKYLRKEYKNLDSIVVEQVVSCALGNLREFLIVKTQNKHHQSPEYVLIPRKREQMVNMGSLTEALKQSQQITQSTNIYYFEKPGPQFDRIYASLAQLSN